ncbi:MAG: glycosyltransferase [Bacteroidetes bacterium]|nr:glycosyltransferase [Bacteroidota bacterium]
MIPKIIHYCWFGPNEKSEVAKQCIESWKKHCPDYELKEWNESNSKFLQNKFYKDAYRKRKYAFVADVIRVEALTKYGGIYMDLDMLLVKALDPLLKLDFFSGFEVPERAAYGLFGGVANHRFFKEMKAFYDITVFNPYSLPVITHAFAPLMQIDNLKENETLLEPEYFYALPYEEREKDYKSYITAHSYAVHLWDHSWQVKSTNETKRSLINKLYEVTLDYVIHGYPYAHFKRYFREFSRKLYHQVIEKKL